MTVSLLTASLAVTLIALALTAYEVWGFPRRRRRCIVNLHSDNGDSIEGVLWTRRGPWLVLKDARLLRANGAVEPADGEIVIEARQVAFIQVF